MPIRREPSGPFDERRFGEMDKRIARLEVPLLLLYIQAFDAERIALGECSVLIGREVDVRRLIVREVSRPGRCVPGVLDDVLERLARAPGYEPQVGASTQAMSLSVTAGGRA